MATATASKPRKLKGQEPSSVQKRLKALFYGPAGVGKTTAAIAFPRPYLIDTERGAENDQYTRKLKERGGAYMFSTDPDEVIDEILTLGSVQHDYRTLIIDPLTIIYADLCDKGMATEGTEFGRYKIPADRKIKHLLNLLARLDMNVIITSHAKAKWVQATNEKGVKVPVQDGITFDCYSRLDYLFDLVFEIAKVGTERKGIVRKTRIEAFAEGAVFPFTYDEIAERYGRECLERSATVETLATLDQVFELGELLKVRADGVTLLDKWLDKANADNPAELTEAVIAKCIAFLKKGGAA